MGVRVVERVKVAGHSHVNEDEQEGTDAGAEVLQQRKEEGGGHVKVVAGWKGRRLEG